MPLRFISGRRLLALQLALVAAVLTAMAASPPSTGRILLVPLSPTMASTMIGRSVATGARLLGRGPFAGSVVVDGSRAKLARALRAPVLLLAAPPAGCHA